MAKPNHDGENIITTDIHSAQVMRRLRQSQAAL
jgi:hypothetical protein